MDSGDPFQCMCMLLVKICVSLCQTSFAASLQDNGCKFLLLAISTLQAADSRQRLMSITGLLCGLPCQQNSAFVRTPYQTELRLSSTSSVFGFVTHPEESWQVLLGSSQCDTAFSCSPTNCLSEEKIGSSKKTQDRVRTFYLFELGLECSKFGFIIVSQC